MTPLSKLVLGFVTFIGPVVVWSLEALPVGTFPDSGVAGARPLQYLQAVAADARYITCRKDLEDFVSQLSPLDLKEIKNQKSKFNGAKLVQLLKSKVPRSAPYKTEIDKDFESVAILIPHGDAGKLKCQLSIYPSLPDGQLKSNIDPTSADVKIRLNEKSSFNVEATLVGVVADAQEGSHVQFAPTKAMTILKQQGIASEEEQISILNQFQETETSTTQPAAPAAGGAR
jgi:hypothetical protein